MDFNAMINLAVNESAKRRSAAMSTMNNVVSKSSMDASGLSSELTMGDIAIAIKSKNAKKHEDNQFISTHGKQFKVTDDEDGSDNNVAAVEAASEITMTSDMANNVQDIICEVQDHTDQVLGRQAEIAHSLKSYQQNPFAT